MSSKLSSQNALSVSALTALAALSTACGQTPTTATSAGNVSLVVPALAGANAASVQRSRTPLSLAWSIEGISSGLLSLMVGNTPAYAASRTFTSFKICNDTLVITDTDGKTVAINGKTSETGLGLLSFTSANTTETTLTSLNIASGTKIKEVKITSAVKGSVCSNAAYAVEFNPG